MWARGSEVRSRLDRAKRQLTAEAQDFANARGLRLEHRALPLAELAERFDLHAQHFACPTALPQPTDNPVNRPPPWKYRRRGDVVEGVGPR